MKPLLGRLAQTGPNFFMRIGVYSFVWGRWPNWAELSDRNHDFARFPPEKPPMLLRTLVLLAGLCLATPALAQTSITLRAAPVAIVDAQINGRPVRLEVDPRLPDVLVLNPAAAERLHVRRVPFVGARVSLDASYIRGRIARPRIEFGDAGASRATTGIFNVPATARADGVIGPGVLPHDIIRIELAGSGVGRIIQFPLANADIWQIETELGGLSLQAVFDLNNTRSTFNRSAASHLDQSGAIVAEGELGEMSMLLGLHAQAQPVQTSLALQGLALGPAVARTRAPLLGALDEETLVVVAEGEEAPPRLWVGRSALASCSSITVNRRTRTLTLECAS